jgi:hypothetical protein
VTELNKNILKINYFQFSVEVNPYMKAGNRIPLQEQFPHPYIKLLHSYSKIMINQVNMITPELATPLEVHWEKL